MGKGSSFKELQLGHAGINPSETLADGDTWRRLREQRVREQEGIFTPPPISRAPWAAVRPPTPAPIPRPTATNVAPDSVTPAATPKAIPTSSPTAIDYTSATPDQIIAAWQATALNRKFLHYYGSLRAKFDRLLSAALDSPEVRSALANRDTLAYTLPVVLGDALLRLTVDTNVERPGGTIHDFLLERAGDEGYVLKQRVSNAVADFARDCVAEIAPATTPKTRITERGRPAAITCPVLSLADIDTRQAFIEHCINYAHHVELPDCAENSSRTNAFRAALRHAIGNIEGISAIDLRNNSDRMRISGKLKHGVRGSALYHLRKGYAPELDYKGLLDDNSKLSTDAFTSINQFVNFTAREFLNERGLSKGNGAAQRG